jgi:hypothetical protein
MWRAKCSPVRRIPVRIRLIACDNVFSGLFLNGAESRRDLEFYKNVAEIGAFNESVKFRGDGGDGIGAGLADDLTIVL